LKNFLSEKISLNLIIGHSAQIAIQKSYPQRKIISWSEIITLRVDVKIFTPFKFPRHNHICANKNQKE